MILSQESFFQSPTLILSIAPPTLQLDQAESDWGNAFTSIAPQQATWPVATWCKIHPFFNWLCIQWQADGPYLENRSHSRSCKWLWWIKLNGELNSQKNPNDHHVHSWVYSNFGKNLIKNDLTNERKGIYFSCEDQHGCPIYANDLAPCRCRS